LTDPATTDGTRPAPASPDTAHSGNGGPRRTPLTEVHRELGATLTDFAGWLMPLRYGSETAEHHAVRTAAGLFDLSHMGELMVTGPGAGAALDYALVGNLAGLQPGRARYTMITAPDGGVLDDLIVYRLGDTEFLVVANAANAGAVRTLLTERAAGRDAAVTDQTDDYALIALQGPRAAGILGPLTDISLDAVKYYASYPGTVAGHPVLLARTGYTGEDGFEIFARPPAAGPIWRALSAAGADRGLLPAGLAARDSLRLEAGMPLYGNELGRDVTPYEAGLPRVVRLDKPGDFVGREALAKAAAAVTAGDGPERTLIGLIARSRRVPRHGYPVLSRGAEVGTVTSGAPSPTLGVPVAMAYVTRQVAEPGAGTEFGIDVRGRVEPADRVELPFYRRSQQA
jgi:aminomethyltransferase